MKANLLFTFGLFLLSVTDLMGADKDSVQHFSIDKKSVYSFIIEDSPAQVFTMRQLNEDYLSGYRLFSNMLEDHFSPALTYGIQAVTGFLFFIPFTHEEAHRSILSGKNIGSVSRPFFFSQRGGYVLGVTDESLKNLRDTDFPVYSRMHSAGIESDYMLTHREEELISFEKEKFRSLAVEYFLRKAMILQYYLMGFVKYDTDGEEESDERLRDIVGNDIYSNIRHLYRPDMDFQRYTRYSDLTSQEVGYLHKMGLRSLFNLINPNIIGLANFSLSANTRINFGMGHIMCPFGDFIDENVWVMYRKKLMVESYVREFQNNQKWFLGGGLAIKNYPVCNRFIFSANLHLWNQPENLGFNDRTGKFGGAFEWVGRYFFISSKKNHNNAASLDLGFTWKTEGYLPEEIVMDNHFGFRVGTSIALDKRY